MLNSLIIDKDILVILLHSVYSKSFGNKVKDSRKLIGEIQVMSQTIYSKKHCLF